MKLIPRRPKCKFFADSLAWTSKCAEERLIFDNSRGAQVACSFQSRQLTEIAAAAITPMLWHN
jgi:hypothetical protein